MKDLIRLVVIKNTDDEGNGGENLSTPTLLIPVGTIDTIFAAFKASYPQYFQDPNPDFNSSQPESGQNPRYISLEDHKGFARTIRLFVEEIVKAYVVELQRKVAEQQASQAANALINATEYRD